VTTEAEVLAVAEIAQRLGPNKHAVIFESSEIPELRVVLDRAMNTWEPAEQPPWLQGLSDAVDRLLTRSNA
jgi:hypothetical protein